MNKKILALLSALVLIVNPMTAYAYNAATPATYSVNYVVSTNTLFTVELASASPQQTMMNFTGGRNKIGVEPEGQDKSISKPWATITNLGEVVQDFKVSLNSANPPSIQLNVSNSNTMLWSENMAVTTTPASPSGWTNVAAGSGHAYLYAGADFVNSPDGKTTRTIKLEGTEHQTLSGLTVSPATATVKTGGSQTFSATATDQFGNTMTGVTVTWSIDSGGVGSIDSSSGAYSAGPTEGTATINATATVEGVTKTATATVTVYTPVLESITVTPAIVDLNVGGGQAFTATSRDQNGNIMTGVTVTWSIDGGGVGSIDPSTGMYSAGPTEGTAIIRATSGSKSGTATVNVIDPNAV